MTKFYVKSGKIRKVIFAADANAAALWLMNIVMEKFYPDQTPGDVELDPFALIDGGLFLLADEVLVSRQAFASDSSAEGLTADNDVERYDTVELFTEWNELVTAVRKMEKMILGKQPLRLCELAS